MLARRAGATMPPRCPTRPGPPPPPPPPGPAPPPASPSDPLPAGEPAFDAAARRAVAGIRSAPYVIGVLSHAMSRDQVSTDGHTAYDVVTLDLPADDSPLALPGIRAALVEVPELEVGLAGGPAFYGDVQEVSEADLRRSEL